MRLGRGQRIVEVSALVVLVVGFVGVSHAQSGWLIVPGKSWGPVFIGETEDGVMSVLGPPGSRSDSAMASSWKYPKVWLQFIRRVSENPSDTLQLWRISVWDPAAVTREGVGVGARLPNVLRTYGGTSENLIPNLLRGDSPNIDPADCLDIVINGDRSGSQTSFDTPTMSLTYLDRGVGFDLNWAGTPGAFLVTTITVMNPNACRPLFGR